MSGEAASIANSTIRGARIRVRFKGKYTKIAANAGLTLIATSIVGLQTPGGKPGIVVICSTCGPERDECDFAKSRSFRSSLFTSSMILAYARPTASRPAEGTIAGPEDGLASEEFRADRG